MSEALGNAGDLTVGTSNPLTIPSEDAPQNQLKQDEKLSMLSSGSSSGGSTYKVLASSSDTEPGFLSDKVYSTQFAVVSNEIRLIGFGSLTTDSLIEGSTNLFFTSDNFNTLLAGKTSDDIIEGSSNKYMNLTNFNSYLALKTTDDLPQGSSNLYFTTALSSAITANTAARHTHDNLTLLSQISSLGSGQIMTSAERTKLAGIEAGAGSNSVLSVNGIQGNVILDTDDISEDSSPTNMWFTNARAVAALSSHTSDSSIHFSDLSSFTTTNLVEGTNLYYTDARVVANSVVALNTAARHSHSNFALIETYTQSNAAIASAVTNNHTHSNKTILDNTEVAFTSAMHAQYEGYSDTVIHSALTPLDLTSGVLSHDLSDGNKHVPTNASASQYYVLSSGTTAGSYDWQDIKTVIANSAVFESTPSTSTTLGIQSAYIYNLVNNNLTDLNLLTSAQLTSVTTTFPAHISNTTVHLPTITATTDQGKFLMVNSSDEPEWSTSSTSISSTGLDYISVSESVITASAITLAHTSFNAGSNITIDTGSNTIEAVQREIDQSPSNGEAVKSISSGWAYDHVSTTGNEAHVPSTGTSGYFLAWDGTYKDISSYVNVDVLDYVTGMQVDATFDPGLSPTTGVRYILLDVANLHANFGTITGVANNDIVEYSGSAFTISFDASAATASITVTVTNDKNGNSDREWYYSVSGSEWRDRGVSANIYWSRNDTAGTVTPLTTTDSVLLYSGAKLTWENGTAYITENTTNVLSFFTNSSEAFQINTTAVVSILPVNVNVINEYTTDAGVTIDNVAIKDNTVTATTLYIEDANTSINKDASNNLTFTDAVTGTKTLAELLAGSVTQTYIDTHLGGQTLGSLVTTPTVTQDGYALVWDNANTQYTLAAQSGGVAQSYVDAHIASQDVASLVASPTVTQDGYVIAWNNTNSNYELVAQSGGSSVSYGSTTQVPYTNTSADGFLYSSRFAYNGIHFVVGDSSTNMSIAPTTATRTNLTGANNILLGSGSLTNATDSNNFIVLGNSAAASMMYGSYSIFIGHSVADSIEEGDYNTVIGHFAGQKGADYDDDGTTRQRYNNNTYIGAHSGRTVTSDDNVIIGYETARDGATLSDGNTIIGYQACDDANTLTGRSVIIGYKTASDASGSGGAIIIGNQAATSQDITNKLWIANSNTLLPIISGDMSTSVTAQTLNINASVNYYTGSLTDGAPTNAEINAIITTTFGAGYEATIKDSDGSGLMYKVVYDGSGWHYTAMTAAT